MSPAVDTASPTTHSRSSRARASGAIEVLNMFCETYVNKQMANRARSVALPAEGRNDGARCSGGGPLWVGRSESGTAPLYCLQAAYR